MSWRSVAQLARNDIISTHPIEVDQIMKLWYIRWSALVKLKLYDVIQAEVDKLSASDLQSLCYNDYQDIFPEKRGTMLTFDLLLLISNLPSYKGNHHESIHKLYKLLYAQKPYDFRPTKENHFKILLNVVKLLVKIPDIPLALSLLLNLINDQPENVDLWAIYGRLQLQIGDFDNAKISFDKVCLVNEVEALLGIQSNQSLPSDFPRAELVLAQRGFILFSQDKFAEALGFFTDLLTLMPDSPSAINNVAICHLYAGNVGQAASFLESFMVSHPQLGGDRPELLFNLNSMYDLTDSSLQKKRALLKVIIQGCGDDFDPDCMKL